MSTNGTHHTAYIMHKDMICMSFIMNEDGLCCGIKQIINKDHLPKGINGTILSVNRFLQGRQLSNKRADVLKIKDMGIIENEMLLPFHFLSPFDCYWVRFDGERMPFNAISLYNNYPGTDVFTLTEDTVEDIDRDTANLSFHNKKQQFYVMSENESDKFKGKFLTEAYISDKSVFLQNIYAKYLSVLRGQYSIYKDKLFYDVPDVTSLNMEYIPYIGYFWEFWEKPENAGYTEKEALFESFRLNNFPDWEQFFSRLISMDEKYNLDRSLDEFGILRNPDTLEIISIAPLFSYPLAV